MSLEPFATTERQRRALQETGIVTIGDLIRAAHGGDSQDDVITVGLDRVFDVCNNKLCHIVMRGSNLKTDPQVTIHGRRPDTMVTYRCDTRPVLKITPCSFIDDDLIPPEWYCPLTHEVFVNPMVLSDGYTYEEADIRQWLERNNTSPMTGETLNYPPFLVPNKSLRDWITRLS